MEEARYVWLNSKEKPLPRYFGDMITEEQLKENPKMAALVAKAFAKEAKTLHVKSSLNTVMVIPTVTKLAALDHYTEDEECEMLVTWLDELIMINKLVLFTHIPNETYTESNNAKRKNKMLGVRPGFPDYAILTTKHFIVVEMKRKKGGVVSSYQQGWIDQFTAVGIPAKVCNGFLEAQAFIVQYL
jgi:hypothetical protein